MGKEGLLSARHSAFKVVFFLYYFMLLELNAELGAARQKRDCKTY